MNDGSNQHSSDDIFVDQKRQTMKVQKREEGMDLSLININIFQIANLIIKQNTTEINSTKKLAIQEEVKGNGSLF